MKIVNALKKTLILSLIAIAPLCSSNLWAEGMTSPSKRVLVIFIFKQGMPWPYYLEESMRTALSAEFGSSLELNVEYADQTRFPEKTYRSKAIDLYHYKYSKQKMDLVLVLGAESLDLMVEYGGLLFDDTPVVLITSDQQSKARDLLKSNMVSMFWGFDFAKTGALIHELLPQTKHLFVISGVSMMDQNLKALAVKELAQFEERYAIHYLDDYSKQDLLLKVTQLPDDSAIFFISLFRDVNGKSYVPRDVMTEVSEKSNAPLFGMVDTYLGNGIVGGDLLSASYQGKKYAKVIEKVLHGEPLGTLKNMKNGNQLIFDWRQIKRWSIDEDHLPAGSIVRHRKLSTWEEHQWEIVGVSLIISFQAFALIGLLIQHKRRRKAEEESQRLKDERAHISRVLTMGEIAASLAHEINQPLSAIRSYAQAGLRFLNNTPVQTDEVSKVLEGIITGNRRAEEVIQRIRMALKKQPVKRTRLDVNDIIKEASTLLQSKFQEHKISLRLEIATGLLPVFGDRVQLQQVLFNLILNAIDAITASLESSSGEVVVLALTDNKLKSVTIAVRDNGIGIDKQQGESMFEAFYTTKPEGMGIGLSISRSIIEDHGGQFWVTKNPDKGVTFSFTVPIYKGSNK